MKAKSGKSIKAVAPAKPDEVINADISDPGAATKAEIKDAKGEKDKYGSQKVKPFKKPDKNNPQPGDEKKTSWVEIEMIDEADEPVAGLRYEVKLPDGSVASGTLDGNGFARIEPIEPGNCEICFPDLDKDAWEPL